MQLVAPHALLEVSQHVVGRGDNGAILGRPIVCERSVPILPPGQVVGPVAVLGLALVDHAIVAMHEPALRGAQRRGADNRR